MLEAGINSWQLIQQPGSRWSILLFSSKPYLRSETNAEHGERRQGIIVGVEHTLSSRVSRQTDKATASVPLISAPGLSRAPVWCSAYLHTGYGSANGSWIAGAGAQAVECILELAHPVGRDEVGCKAGFQHLRACTGVAVAQIWPVQQSALSCHALQDAEGSLSHRGAVLGALIPNTCEASPCQAQVCAELPSQPRQEV